MQKVYLFIIKEDHYAAEKVFIYVGMYRNDVLSSVGIFRNN